MKLLEENAVIPFLKKFDAVPFLVNIGGHDHIIGEEAGEPLFRVIFHKVPDIKEMMTSTSLALGEAYMRGEIEIEGSLYDALYHFLGQMEKFSTNRRALKKLLFSSSSQKNQKEEVCSHYDIGNNFYRLWLDPTMSYSCGYFPKQKTTLEEAQKEKVSRILEKLCLKEGMTLLDIGCGWGYLLTEAARKYKIKGVGITLSLEQHAAFKEKIRKEGLEDYLDVRIMDYRDLAESGLAFDRVVSVGMLEHVGRKNYELFLSKVKAVMNPGGLFLLHYISALKEFPGDPWIKKYIFPGGMVPSLREIVDLTADYQFYVLDIESLRRHYNRTLLCWAENFNKHREEVEQSMGVEFARMWDLYLCGCAATFQNGIIDLHQILMTNGVNNDLPMTRWY